MMHPISKKRSLSINTMLPMLFVLLRLQNHCGGSTIKTSHKGTQCSDFHTDKDRSKFRTVKAQRAESGDAVPLHISLHVLINIAFTVTQNTI